MKGAQLNCFLVVFCFGTILYHMLVNTNILMHPYMICLIPSLFLVGGYNFGVLLGKFYVTLFN